MKLRFESTSHLRTAIATGVIVYQYGYDMFKIGGAGWFREAHTLEDACVLIDKIKPGYTFKIEIDCDSTSNGTYYITIE